MCGITGAFNLSGLKQQDIDVVKKFSDAISHRGPDAEGFYNDKFVSFGHRRLSIIDLSESSNQPMTDDSGDIVLVFNGEIYNHEEIRPELNEFKFRTDHSDTEVIINAYKKWGIDALQRFTGMFAIALYDRKRGEVYLVRDRLGKKPLYWTEREGTIYFSSENQSFFESGLLKKEFNDEAIYHYLTFLTAPAPMTFFKNVKKIESGYYYKFTKDGTTSRQYWNIADYLNKEEPADFDKAVRESRRLLERSMKMRNVADVPISIALSGGLDSSMNLHYTVKNRPDLVSSINISYEETSEFDESVIAERYSQEMGAKYFPKVISQKDFVDWIEEYLQTSSDVPIGDPNSALMYGISKIARENGFKVLLVGEGGDELGGYPIYAKLEQLDKIQKLVPGKVLSAFSKLPIPARYAKTLDSISDGAAYLRRFIFGFTEKQKKTMWKGSGSYDSYKVMDELAGEIRDDLNDSFLRKVLNIEYKLRLAELLLPRVDYPSMATSIEARSPFMDHSLIEYTSKLPFSLKMKNGTKSILKAIAKEILPAYIIEAPKVGFGMLLTPFLKETMPVWFKSKLLDQYSPVTEYVSKDFLQNLYDDHMKSKNLGYQMWILYSLHRWMIHNEKS